MKRRLATLAAASMFALMLGATPALASPVQHFSFPATDLNAEGGLCGYTFTSGQFALVARDTSTAAHGVLRSVLAEKDGSSFKVLGSETYNDLKGHLTIKIMFIGEGGLADSVNVVIRDDGDGGYRVAKENDSCHIYG